MVKFDWSAFRFVSKENYNEEVKNSKSIQDEVKVFNERFPKWLEPLHKLTDEVYASEGGSGEFKQGQSEGDSFQEQIWSYFYSLDYSPEAIAGIMGNIGTETMGTFDPTTLQGGVGPGTGIIQWEDGASGRWNELEAWAEKEGRDKWEMQTQLDYVVLEMNQQYHINLFSYNLKKYGVSPGNDPVYTFSQLDDVETAMYVFELTIERAGDKNYESRLSYANEMYEKFKNWTPSSGVSNGSFVAPYKTSYVTTSEFGPRTINGVTKLHAGIDLDSGGFNSIYAIGNGKVVANSYHYQSGHYVVVDHGVLNGKQIFGRYQHLNATSPVSVGTTVTIDTKVGTEGNTGTVYGSVDDGRHLHFEISEFPEGSTYSYGGQVDPRNHINFTGEGR